MIFSKGEGKNTTQKRGRSGVPRLWGQPYGGGVGVYLSPRVIGVRKKKKSFPYPSKPRPTNNKKRIPRSRTAQMSHQRCGKLKGKKKANKAEAKKTERQSSVGISRIVPGNKKSDEYLQLHEDNKADTNNEKKKGKKKRRG